MSGHKPINLGPVTGHVVREDIQRNRVPHGRGVAVVLPNTAQVYILNRSQLADAESWAANQKRNGRARNVRGR